MVDPQRRDPACGKDGWLQNIGCIVASAQSDFDNAGIGRDAGELQERCGYGDFEKAGPEIFARVEHFGQERGKPFIAD